MATKPDKKPEWARVAEVDPVSGQNNYVEPPESKKNIGYTRAEIPPRQWINWLLKKCGEWIGYFEEVTDELLADVGGFEILSYIISDSLYIGERFDFSAQSTNPRGLCFSSGGTKMYISSQEGAGPFTGFIYQYSLSAPYDVSTASYDSKSFETTTQSPSPDQIILTEDGLTLFVVEFTGSVYQYTLSTAYDISTASYDSVSLDATTESNQLTSGAFSSGGTVLFLVGIDNNEVYQYSLSTAYDMSTASYDSVSLDISGETTDPSGLSISEDGLRLFVCDEITADVFQYNLSTPNDLSTASYLSISYSITEDSSLREIQFNDDGTKMFILGDTNDTVYQYRTSRVVGA